MNEPGPMNIGSMFQFNEERWKIYTNTNGVMLRMDTKTGATWALLQSKSALMRWTLVMEEPNGDRSIPNAPLPLCSDTIPQ